jgi:hypothetical protein
LPTPLPRVKYSFGRPVQNNWFRDLLYSRWVLLQMLAGSLLPIVFASRAKR